MNSFSPSVSQFLFTKYFLWILVSFHFNISTAQNWDIDLLKEINLQRNKSLDPTFTVITNSVTPLSFGAPIVLIGIGQIIKDTSIRNKGIILGEAFCVNAFTTTALKYAIHRDRPFVTYPYIDKQADAGSLSFPSGHTSSAFALATSLSLTMPKWYVIAPAYLYASAVGYSRMHLGVHYPSDIVAGALVGTGSAYLSHHLEEIISHSKRKKRIRL
jgi:membrane-associated phospholipid phosphatase